MHLRHHKRFLRGPWNRPCKLLFAAGLQEIAGRYVDLRSEFDEKEWVCAYAACWIDNPAGPRETELRMGSNDSIKVFLDGKEIWNKKVDRIATVDEDRVRATLPQGKATILLKIGQTGKNWGFYFQLIEPGTENPMQGISISAQPPK